MNIKRKHIELDTRCPICMRMDEDGGHLFLKCKQAKQVWRELQLEDVHTSLVECANPLLMFEHVWSLAPTCRDLVLMLLWEWWNTRNKANQGEKVKPCEVIAYNVRGLWDDFRGKADTVEAPGGQPAIVVWTKPSEGYVKVNFDAAFFAERGSGAWGCVARSSQGEFIGACVGKLEHLASPLQAEATACVQAIEAAAEMGFHRVVFESDSLQLVNAINSGDHDLSSIGVLLREARSLCFASFDAFQFKHCKRSCNNVAHSLADFGFRANVACTWCLGGRTKPQVAPMTW